jgi:hypothetical protein
MVHYLMKKPVMLVQVNPMHTKRIKEITDNSPLKSGSGKIGQVHK